MGAYKNPVWGSIFMFVITPHSVGNFKKSTLHPSLIFNLLKFKSY